MALAKPRLNVLVVASLAGYAMAGGESGRVALVLSILAGTGLVAGGASWRSIRSSSVTRTP